MTTEQKIEEVSQAVEVKSEDIAPHEEIEIIPEPEAQEEAPETEAEQEKEFNPRTDKVDFSTPEQQEKFNYIYKQVKQSDARNQMLMDMLETATQKIGDLEGRFTQTDEADAKGILVNKIKHARSEGNDEAEISAIEELAEFLAEKKVQKVNKPAVAEVEKFAPQKAQETQYIQNLMTETDIRGDLVRPWLNENDPKFYNAINELEKISVKYIGDPFALQKSLADLDIVMTQKKEPPKNPPTQTRAPNPMQGGNLTNHKPKATIKLTKAELDIAKKLGVDPKRYAAKRDEIKQRGR